MSRVAPAVKRFYEAVVILHPDATIENQKEIFKKNKTTIENFKGQVFSLETWGKRNLANPIGKIKRAHYFHMIFESSSQAVAEIERTMRINDKVLRFMHTRLDERLSMQKHMEVFRKGLAESAQRERDREAKIQAKRAAQAAASQDRF